MQKYDGIMYIDMSGNEEAAIEAMQRTRGSMREVLELVDIPEIDENDPELDHMRLTELVSRMHFDAFVFVWDAYIWVCV